MAWRIAEAVWEGAEGIEQEAKRKQNPKRETMKSKVIAFEMALIIGLSGCGYDGVSSREPKLNSVAHEEFTLPWAAAPIRADTRWRFISHKLLQQGIEVTGAWDITLRNTGHTDYEVRIGRLAFEDASGFQVAEYTPLFGVETVRVKAGEVKPRQGNFTIEVASITIANSITRMEVWASFTEL